MKKLFVMASSLLMGFVLTCTSCSDDNKEDNPDTPVAAGESFVCVKQILDGCIDIATEVGESKIGDPLDKFNSGQTEEALYSVESWYSWHSRDDYKNNIVSIRNAYYGSRDGSVATNSLSALLAGNNAEMDKAVKNAINEAWQAIDNIPQPFRNNINSNEAKAAQQKCAELVTVLGNLSGYIERTGAINQDKNLEPIISDYVDNVVLPTYLDLKTQNANLFNAVKAFRESPSDAAFEAVSEAWMIAREPWETSEAFLFGPVDNEGLDPNMDSWPLDQDAIVNILNSGNFDDLDWTDGDSEDAITAKQEVRGFHTLEFLVFRNGQARTTSDTADSSQTADIVYNSSNAKSWANYMYQVAFLLQKDASDLYSYWNDSYKGGDSYAKRFKAHTNF